MIFLSRMMTVENGVVGSVERDPEYSSQHLFPLLLSVVPVDEVCYETISQNRGQRVKSKLFRYVYTLTSYSYS